MPYLFPSVLQKFIRVPIKEVYEALSQFLEEACSGRSDEEKTFKANVGKGVGVALKIQLLPEGEASLLTLKFNYRGLILIILASLAVSIGLSLFTSSFIPLFLSVVLMPIFAYRASSAVERFLDEFSKILHGLEIEYARRKLMEDRVKWQRSPKNVNDLYERLCEIHMKTWGDTFTLEYKIKEYQRQGLTRNEAIRKIAEEEGIF